MPHETVKQRIRIENKTEAKKKKTNEKFRKTNHQSIPIF
ncbi:hypothetical protein LEP1GSC059_3394 [Leptospira noguchii serovar Panama str. CZ214]|uniref:Uncharacterized protein n=1 Tax=Leptospira noguchii serovar Panama str. CZ214 TaxID=1001595 RepID=T0FTI4_9LEPT|nr:hypothetical protein LEP1GSC059_3394 [Leptospira noguchii serovar Panama str. CZ214]